MRDIQGLANRKGIELAAKHHRRPRSGTGEHECETRSTQVDERPIGTERLEVAQDTSRRRVLIRGKARMCVKLTSQFDR